jgi:hypothetical protein
MTWIVENETLPNIAIIIAGKNSFDFKSLLNKNLSFFNKSDIFFETF